MDEYDAWTALGVSLGATQPKPLARTYTRAIDTTAFDDQLAAIRRSQSSARPFRAASVDEALGVPAILGAVSLIMDTVGSLSLEGYRQGVLLQQADAPRLLIRPNPLTTPFRFFMLSAFHKATRGERWWWVAKRDTDGSAMSLYPVPPWEITVEANDRNPLRPTIRWRNVVMPNEDMVQDIYFPDSTGLRGRGPLQLAGAAVSVAYEAQVWAANFFAGNLPSVIGTTEQDLSEAELKLMDEQWSEKPANLPRWLTNGLTLSETPFQPDKAQLQDTRQFQVGEVARMFGMPGELLEYQMSGSSLTYQNQSDIWNDFQRRCLSPHYLEPMEQDMSDLLTRATVARFNLDQLLRADIKTRYETWKSGIEAGFLLVEEARRKEGLAPGAVDYAPVPLAPPQAVPAQLPIARSLPVLREVRCPRCGRLNGKTNGYVETICKKCGELVRSAA